MRKAVMDLQLDNPETQRGYLTLSIGIATLEGQDDTPDEMMEAADVRLYQAKREGRNRICSA